MGIAIDESLLDDLNDPGFDVLNYAIDQHKQKKDRLKRLNDYYDGKQDILSHQMQNNQHSSNNKVLVNHAKYITDMITGFIAGNPISYSPGKDKNIDAIVQLFQDLNIQKHDIESEKDLSVFGSSFELLYAKDIGTPDKPRTEVQIGSIDPRGMVMVTDDTIEHNPLFAIHIQPKYTLKGSDSGFLISVYTKTNVIQYRTYIGSNLSDGNIKTKIVKKHYFGDVPVVEYRNNEERQGDYEQNITQINAYNTLQSDRITDKQDFIDALLVVYGFSLQGEKDDADSKKLRNGLIDGAPGKGEEGASVEWLTKQLDEQQVELLSKSIENDIHKTSYVPNMNDENFMGNVSGEAMKYKLFGLLNLLSVKSMYLIEGLKRRLTLVQHFLQVQGQATDISGCKITITPNIPVNLSDVISNIKNADGIIPRVITYSWLPDVDNPKDVEKQLTEQKTDDIKTSQKALIDDKGANIDQPPYSEEDSKDDPSNNKKKSGSI
ncbi:phage portal protein [Oenococcus oeni]|uniref:phage portal protein n=1 Tax=Oenococcus oeni TaxID=1247 RepID=UPI0008F955E8|nr:phage portal protein [Oenococcus oeni]OIM22401.1 phage portal protein [Oenococcus oeni]